MYPFLMPIDLTKGDGHHHPDIRPGRTQYLVLIDGRYYAGTFSEQWYGLNFCPAWGANSHQYDKPGTNYSGWEAVWEIHTFSK